MANELAVDTCRGSIHISILVKEMIQEAFGKEGETFTQTASRLLTDMVKDMKPSKRALDASRQQTEANYRRRMDARNELSKLKQLREAS